MKDNKSSWFKIVMTVPINRLRILANRCFPPRLASEQVPLEQWELFFWQLLHSHFHE